jgi:hypothetical protein
MDVCYRLHHLEVPVNEPASRAQMSQIMTLLAPSSVAAIAPGARSEPPMLDSPVAFAWEPVTDAVGYHYRVVREQESGAQVAAESEGPDPSWTVDLASGRFWLDVQANGSHGEVGSLARSATFVVP